MEGEAPSVCARNINVPITAPTFEYPQFWGRCFSASVKAGYKGVILNLSYLPGLCRALSIDLHRVPSCLRVSQAADVFPDPT